LEVSTQFAFVKAKRPSPEPKSCEPSDPNYLNKFRNPVLSFFTGERLLILYSKSGIDAVIEEVQKLRNAGVI
jgi:hypothetical protein